MSRYTDLKPIFKAMNSADLKLKLAGAAALAGVVAAPYVVSKAREGAARGLAAAGRETERAVGYYSGRALSGASSAVGGLFRKKDSD